MPKPRPLPPRAGRDGSALLIRFALAVTAFAFSLGLAVVKPCPAQGVAAPARQVTLFGVIATPYDTAIDPKLARIEPQLRKLLPNHGFKLLGVQSKRLTAGQTLTCDLGSGFTAAATLNRPSDDDGKVRLQCAVLQNRAVQLESKVTTPPNQLFFCEKTLPNGTRLLVGIGAR